MSGGGRIVAADIEKEMDIVLAEDIEYLGAILFIRFVASRTQSGRGSGGDGIELRIGQILQLNEVFLEHSTHAVSGSVDFADFRSGFCGLNDAYERLIDDSGRPAGLTDNSISF